MVYGRGLGYGAVANWDAFVQLVGSWPNVALVGQLASVQCQLVASGQLRCPIARAETWCMHGVYRVV